MNDVLSVNKVSLEKLYNRLHTIHKTWMDMAGILQLPNSLEKHNLSKKDGIFCFEPQILITYPKQRYILRMSQKPDLPDIQYKDP